MSEFDKRLRAILLPLGIETPEALSRRAQISLADAALLMSLVELPPLFDSVAKVAALGKVRNVWLTTGRSVMQSDATIDPADREALAMLADMEPEQRRRWIVRGKRIARSR